MIAAVHFRKFKALRSAAVKLEPFNLVIGPNGSGKTSLIEALLRLRTLAALAPGDQVFAATQGAAANEAEGQPVAARTTGPEIEFHFTPPFQNVRVTLGCNADEFVCNLLRVDQAPVAAGASAPGLSGEAQWAELRVRLLGIRAYRFDRGKMGAPVQRSEGAELAADAGNLGAVLAERGRQAPAALARLEEEFCRIMPEFAGLDFRAVGEGAVELQARLAGSVEVVPADRLSEGTLYFLALLALAHAPAPPPIVCIEEADRGVHPRLLREVRDALYRLSYPPDGEGRAPVQVIATTHSPYLLDLFKEHPEEVVLASKHGNAATFTRLSDYPDVSELLKESHLGDLWYSGILGGVPGE